MKKIALFLFVFFISQPTFAADQTIEMLNKLGKEHMVYSQKIVNIEVGDSIFWKATTKGHNVEFIKGGTPDGVEKFNASYKDIEDEKLDEVVKYISFLKENPS